MKKATLILTFVLSLIGACAWLPWVFDLIKKPKVEVRLIAETGKPGWYDSDGIDVEKGMFYIQQYSLFAINEGFDYKDIKVKIKYPNTEFIEAYTFWPHNMFFTPPGKKDLKKVVLGPKDELLHHSYLPLDEPITGYLTFITDSLVNDFWEKIRFEFVRFDNSSFIKEIDGNDIQIHKLGQITEIFKDLTTADSLELKSLNQNHANK